MMLSKTPYAPADVPGCILSEAALGGPVFGGSGLLSEEPCSITARVAMNEAVASYKHYEGGMPRQPTGSAAALAQTHNMQLSSALPPGMVDHDSDLRLSGWRATLSVNPTAATTSSGRQQLTTRIFKAAPDRSHGRAPPDAEAKVLQGTPTSAPRSCRALDMPSENALLDRTLIPLIEPLRQSIQDPAHIVQPWTRGGEPTRDAVRQEEFLRANGLLPA